MAQSTILDPARARPLPAPRWGLLALASGVVAVTAILIESSYLSTMSGHGTGVFAWELARTTGRAEHILAVWGPAGRSAATTASWIDFAFILGYTGMLFGLSRVLARRAPRPQVVLVAGSLAIAAGAANLVAKAIQLLILGQATSQPWPALGYVAALLNYVLLAAAILACLALLAGRRRAA